MNFPLVLREAKLTNGLLSSENIPKIFSKAIDSKKKTRYNISTSDIIGG